MPAVSGVWLRGAQLPSGAAWESAGRRAHVVFDGRLDNRAELIRDLHDRVNATSSESDAALIATCFDTWGDDAFARLIGDFALAVFDATQHRLLLVRDAIGVKPLYYSATSERVVFASDITTVLRDPSVARRPNERLLAGMMLGRLHRQPDSGETCFDGVWSVPAAHIAEFDDRTARVRRYFEFSADAIAEPVGFEDRARELRDLLSRAVTRRVAGGTLAAISVSGGLDSAALLCLARRSGAHAMAFTYTANDGSAADESRFVAAIERELGEIERIDTPAAGAVLGDARAVIRRVEAPMLDVQGNRSAAFMKAIAQRGARVLLTGHWGDQLLFDQAYLVDELRRGSWGTVRSHLREYRNWFPDSNGSEFSQRVLSDALDHAAPRWVRPMARRVRGVGRAPEWWQSWYTTRFVDAAAPDTFDRAPLHTGRASALSIALFREVRSKYHALCLETSSKISAACGLQMTFPYLDRDLVGFLMRVPGEHLVRGGVPKALLREAMRGVVPEEVRLRSSKGDFSGIVNAGARRDIDAIAHLLSRDPLVVQFGYADADNLKAGLRRAELELSNSQSCVASWRLADIVALELWLQEFFGTEEAGHA